jgi:hypothetical protein
MNPRQAVSATVKYADFFHFPLSPQEVHYWLITDKPTPFSSVKPFLTRSLTPKEKKFRLQVSSFSSSKTEHAEKMTNVLRFVPGLKLVALTGSVAAGNSRSDDDIDLLIITSPYTLWLVRPLVLLLMTLFFRRRYPGEDHAKAANAFCPNLWLDSLSLSIPLEKRNLYTAHEVLQIVPLLDRGNTYRQFLYHNRWVKKYLANAYTSLASSQRISPSSKVGSPGSKILKYILAPFNLIFFVIQFLYMYSKKTTESVHLHSAFLHTTDFASKIDRYLKTV